MGIHPWLSRALIPSSSGTIWFKPVSPYRNSVVYQYRVSAEYGAALLPVGSASCMPRIISIHADFNQWFGFPGLIRSVPLKITAYYFNRVLLAAELVMEIVLSLVLGGTTADPRILLKCHHDNFNQMAFPLIRQNQYTFTKLIFTYLICFSLNCLLHEATGSDKLI